MPFVVYAWAIAPAFLPLVFVGVPGLAYSRVLRRRRLQLETASAADPPLRAGEAARCHVCGGELTSRGAAAIARCTFCFADNLVAPAVVRRAARSHLTDITKLKARVTARASSATSASVAGVLVLPAVTLAAPVLMVLLWALALYSSSRIEGPIDRSVRLAWVTADEGRCLISFEPDKAPGERIPFSQLTNPRESTASDPVDAHSLVGKRLWIRGAYGSSYTGTVRGAYSSPVLGKNLYLNLDAAGTEHHVEVSAVSICEPPIQRSR